jgi:electron transfer flavoprotein alpha subunit
MLPRAAAAALAVSRRTATSSSYHRWASTLVISEPLLEGGITPAGTQSAVTAAQKLGNTSIDLLVVGGQAPTQIPDGVAKVYHVTGNGIDSDDQKRVVGETVAAAIQAVATSKDCNIVVGTSSKFGSSIVPRAAALLDVSPVTDILDIQDSSKI